MTEKNLIYYIWLTELPGIGVKAQRKLIAAAGSPENIWDMASFGTVPEPVLGLSDGQKWLSRKQKETILGNRGLETAEKILEDCRRKDIGVLTFDDSLFPNCLKDIEDMPVVMYYKGHIRHDINTENHMFGVVGARRCTQADKRETARISDELIAGNASIVSGMAKGVDSYAHTATINRGGYTIAVLGNGLDICYPKEHDFLMQRLCESGLLLSEYKPGTEPMRYSFPKRNRIIAALSEELYVIGAGRHSGALITADFARKYGRRVHFIGDRL